jgi:hypothetical protein
MFYNPAKPCIKFYYKTWGLIFYKSLILLWIFMYWPLELFKYKTAVLEKMPPT